MKYVLVSLLRTFFICGSLNVSHISCTSPGAKKRSIKLDVGAQESHVGQSLAKSLSSTSPHARPLYVNADEVDIGKQARKPYGILAPATPKLKHYGVVVVEIHLAPTPLHLERNIVYN